MHPIGLLREFTSDFIGVGAARKPNSYARDTPTSALITLATIGSYLKSTRDFIVDVLGIPGAFMPAVIALAAFVACIVVISSKKTVNIPAGFNPAPAATRQYSFGVWTRQFAKVAFIILALMIPSTMTA